MNTPFKKSFQKIRLTKKSSPMIVGMAKLDFLLLKSFDPATSHMGKMNEINLGIESKALTSNNMTTKTIEYKANDLFILNKV